ERDLDRVGQLIDAAQHGTPRLVTVDDLLGHDYLLFFVTMAAAVFFAAAVAGFAPAWPLMTASTSSSFMIRYSTPSSLISWPEYLPKRIVSPAFTSSFTRSPSSLTLPLPAALTVPRCGFSLAESGMMMPPTCCSPSSRRWTRIRSWRGRTFMVSLQADVNEWTNRRRRKRHTVPLNRRTDRRSDD